jgi:catechol 2,3-dioxygenase-like lactoylglutathione lyase family enzyme
LGETITDLITFVYTHDLAAADSFYRAALGLPLTLDQGGCRIYRVGRDAYLGVCERDFAPTGSDDPCTQHVIITLVVDDVDAWFERARDAGAHVDQTPRVNEQFGIYHAFVRDPSGYRVEIQRFLDANWRQTE